MVLSLEQIIQICNAKSVIGENLVNTINLKETQIHHLLYDSRRLNFTDNTIFFAFKTADNDGHKYIKELHNKGIRFFICQQIPDSNKFPNAVFLLVNNTLDALQQIAKYKRENFKKEVIAITGSNGKTIIKEWVVQLAQEDKKICYSPRSYNSQIGVSLSLWQLNSSYDLGLFEAGISKPNEMNRLQEIIQPTIGVFTNIGSAHQINFTTIEEKIQEKLQLFTLKKKRHTTNTFPTPSRLHLAQVLLILEDSTLYEEGTCIV